MVLEKAIEKEPNNSRYRFYLAQCYLNAKDYVKSLENYEKRAEMADHNQETFFSMFMSARLQEVLNMPPEKFIETYKKAYNAWPSRMEPLFYLGSYYLRKQEYQAAYDTFKAALATIPSRADMLFVEYWIYDWGALFNFAQCCYHLKKYDETRAAFAKILEVKELPLQVRQEVINNLSILEHDPAYR
jgi:tetratricopeptide (TPR) repeat protein